VEANYWKENYARRPYYRAGKEYSEYEPAYRYGWESASKPEYRNREWREIEGDLGRGWDKVKGGSRETWNEAREAAHDAWSRVDTARCPHLIARRVRRDKPGPGGRAFSCPERS
jgi:hypothetical protein